MVQRLSKELGLQVLALLLATILWVQATTVQNPIDRFTFDGIPVTYENVAQGLIVAGSLHPSKVNITVKCRRRAGEKLSSASFEARVALDAARAGSTDYPVEITPPPGVEVLEISPAAVSVSLETAASVKLPVEARLIGNPAEGFAVDGAAASPVQVAVYGAASATSRVSRVLAEFDISGATADASGKGSLVAVDSTGAVVTGVTFVPSEVGVTASVVPLPSAESVDVDVTLTGSPAAGYAVINVVSTPGRVEVRPAPGQTIDFAHVLTDPVNIAGATADVQATVKVVWPAGVASVTPTEVQVVVEIGAARSFVGLPVQVKNIPAGLKGSVEPATVDVVFRGSRAILDQLTPADVVVWVDASGRQAGQVAAKVEVTLPDWAKGLAEVASVTPGDVTLTLGR